MSILAAGFYIMIHFKLALINICYVMLPQPKRLGLLETLIDICDYIK